MSPPIKAMKVPRKFIVATIFAATGLSTAPVKGNVIETMIFSNCASSMRSEYENAQIELGDDDLKQTCNCVVEQIINSYSINQAKTACIETEDVAANTSNKDKDI